MAQQKLRIREQLLQHSVFFYIIMAAVRYVDITMAQIKECKT